MVNCFLNDEFFAVEPQFIMSQDMFSSSMDLADISMGDIIMMDADTDEVVIDDSLLTGPPVPGGVHQSQPLTTTIEAVPSSQLRINVVENQHVDKQPTIASIVKPEQTVPSNMFTASQSLPTSSTGNIPILEINAPKPSVLPPVSVHLPVQQSIVKNIMVSIPNQSLVSSARSSFVSNQVIQAPSSSTSAPSPMLSPTGPQTLVIRAGPSATNIGVQQTIPVIPSSNATTMKTLSSNMGSCYICMSF